MHFLRRPTAWEVLPSRCKLFPCCSRDHELVWTLPSPLNHTFRKVRKQKGRYVFFAVACMLPFGAFLKEGDYPDSFILVGFFHWNQSIFGVPHDYGNTHFNGDDDPLE